MIAIAISSSPSLLIADEPTSALDASTASEVLALLKQLQRELKMGLLLISHDPHIIETYTDRKLHLSGGRLESPQV